MVILESMLSKETFSLPENIDTFEDTNQDHIRVIDFFCPLFLDNSILNMNLLDKSLPVAYLCVTIHPGEVPVDVKLLAVWQ